MCGRYALETTKRELWERYLLGEMEADVEERAEIFPSNSTPLIMPGNELIHHRWGFMEPFAKRFDQCQGGNHPRKADIQPAFPYSAVSGAGDCIF